MTYQNLNELSAIGAIARGEKCQIKLEGAGLSDDLLFRFEPDELTIRTEDNLSLTSIDDRASMLVIIQLLISWVNMRPHTLGEIALTWEKDDHIDETLRHVASDDRSGA